MERSRRGAGEPDHSRRTGPCARSAHTGDTGRVLLYPPPTQGDTPHPRGHPHGSAAPSAPPRWSATGAARAARLRRQAQEHRWPRCSPRIAHVLPAAERTSNDAERELLSQRAASRPITARPPPTAVLQPRPRWAGPRSAIRGGRVWHRGRSAPPTPSAPEQHRPHAALWPHHPLRSRALCRHSLVPWWPAPPSRCAGRAGGYVPRVHRPAASTSAPRHTASRHEPWPPLPQPRPGCSARSEYAGAWPRPTRPRRHPARSRRRPTCPARCAPARFRRTSGQAWPPTPAQRGGGRCFCFCNAKVPASPFGQRRTLPSVSKNDR